MEHLSPILSLVGLGLMVGLSGAGSAIGTSIAGQAVIGMVKKKPEAFGNGIVLAALPATQGLYGFVAYFLYRKIMPDFTLFQSSVVFGAGISVGIVCLVSAIYQGKVCASGASAIGSGFNVFGNTIVLAVLPEFYALLSLVSAVFIKGLL